MDNNSSRAFSAEAQGIIVMDAAIIAETKELPTSLSFATVIRATSVSDVTFWFGWGVRYLA